MTLARNLGVFGQRGMDEAAKSLDLWSRSTQSSVAMLQVELGTKRHPQPGAKAACAFVQRGGDMRRCGAEGVA
jgi:hypothetical protein